MSQVHRIPHAVACRALGVTMGWRVSKNTVARSMVAQHLAARPTKKKRRGTTRASRSARKAPDLVKRAFAPPPRPDAIWVGDLTAVPTGRGSFHLASVLDLHSRRCVGFAMGAHHDAALAKAALQVAIAVRGGSVRGVVMHTDQGGEYTGELFARACTAAGVTQSMGRTGSALDNAVAEAFNSTLEFELLSVSRFATRAQARRAVAEWIDEYNTVRRHSAAGMMAPVDYELTRHTTREKKEAATPPLVIQRPGAGWACAAHDAGPLLRPQGSSIASGDALRAPLTRRPRRPLNTDGGQTRRTTFVDQKPGDQLLEVSTV